MSNLTGVELDFMAIQTLEHIALVKIAASLWNHQDIIPVIKKFSKSKCFIKAGQNIFESIATVEKNEKWQKIEEQVTENMKKLNIPMSFRDKMSRYIQSVGLQILNWLEYHKKYLFFEVNLDIPKEFFFTTQGTVDVKKTAELLIKNDNINIAARYKLASIYCLEDHIQQLWNGMPDNQKRELYNVALSPIVMVTKGSFAIFWAYYLRGELDAMDNLVSREVEEECSSFEYLFTLAANSGNRLAAEYFWEKITPKEDIVLKKVAVAIIEEMRGTHLFSGPPNEYCYDVVRYLLSKMSYQTQLEMFETYAIELVNIFLDWPWQAVFLKTVNRIWNFIPEHYYYLIFESIVYKIRLEPNNYSYKENFCNVWQNIPDPHKCCIINDDRIFDLIEVLFNMKDKELIALMFKSATIMHKNKVIFSEWGQDLCVKMIYGEEWDLVICFVKVFTSPEKEIKFKQDIEKHFQKVASYSEHLDTEDKSAERKFIKFSQILEDVKSRPDIKLSNEEI